MTTSKSETNPNEAREQPQPDGPQQAVLTPDEMIGVKRPGDCSCEQGSSGGCSSDCTCGCNG